MDHPVEFIRGYRKIGRTKEYYVKWEGAQEATWEPVRNLEGCEVAIREYWERAAGRGENIGPRRVCECGYGTDDKSNFRKHLRDHDTINPKRYRCANCSYTSNDPSHYKRHCKTHFDSEMELPNSTIEE